MYSINYYFRIFIYLFNYFIGSIHNSNNFFEAQAYYNLGVAHRKLDEIEIAEDYLNKSINLEKNFADAQSELASIKLIKNINERDHSSDNLALRVSDFDKLIKDDSIEESYKSLRMISDDEARRNKVKF